MAECPRCEPVEELQWINDDIGYRCPACYLFVCIPKEK